MAQARAEVQARYRRPMLPLLALVLVAGPGPAAADPTPVLPDQGAPGSARTAWTTLLAAGCRVQQAPPYVWTSLEARILRNAPYAMRGHRFDSEGLAAFFAKDGAAWYRPGEGPVTLPAEELACVERLRLHEEALRGQGFLPAGIERPATDDPGVFEALWFWGSGSADPPYGPGVLRPGAEETWWNAPVSGCEPGQECSGYGIGCDAAGQCYTIAAG